MSTGISDTQGRATRWLVLLLVAFGLVISGYLTYTKLANTPVACVEGSIFDCAAVQAHPIGQIGGIPVALMGFGMYAVLGILVLTRNRILILRQNGTLLYFGVVLLGWLFSMWLVYAQANIIHAWCVWCLMHEFVISVLLVLAIWEVRRHFASIE